MAKELAHFKNFAKLKDTSVAFNDITVIAGKPGTGKSYVMKFMYAIDEIFYRKNNGTLFAELYKSDINLLKMVAKIFFKEENNDIRNKLLDNIKNYEFDKYYNLIEKNLSSERFEIVEDSIKNLSRSLNLNENDMISLGLINFLNSIFSDTNQISKEFSVSNSLFKTSIEGNNIYWQSKEGLNYQEPIFVETPLILEFKKYMTREEGKTPYHIESLLKILDTDYSFTDKEQDKLIKDFTKKSKEVIKGDIESSGDSFIFNKENDKNYDIVNTSSGTKSIGLLQYLVTNKALKKGSVLYWEEPEVHLHPSWQLKMVDLFVELMHAGVKIVFSTHSPFMADYLNALSQRKDFADRISYNVFEEKDGVVENHILDKESWSILQDELMDSFEDILWTYL